MHLHLRNSRIARAASVIVLYVAVLLVGSLGVFTGVELTAITFGFIAALLWVTVRAPRRRASGTVV